MGCRSHPDVLAIRSVPASSLGAGYTSIWLRNPEGLWVDIEPLACVSTLFRQRAGASHLGPDRALVARSVPDDHDREGAGRLVIFDADTRGRVRTVPRRLSTPRVWAVGS